MDLMKDINRLADDYTPAEEPAVDEGMKDMMLKAMDEERHKRKIAELENSAKKEKKKDSLVDKMKKARKKNNWK